MEMLSMSKSLTTIEHAPILNLPPIHPGEILRDELDELGLSANALARALDVPPNRITEVLNGTRAISADTALRLARYFGSSARFWMNLQLSFDLAVAEQERGDMIARQVRPR
jgi:addiction module HigA family antidote